MHTEVLPLLAGRSVEVEDRTKQIGMELFQSIGETEPSLDDQLMEWAMKNPALKARLFHFIDVLPMLATSADIAAHIKSYFGNMPDAPFLLRWGAKLGWPAAAIAKWNATRMARRFIAGETAGEVLRSVERMRRDGLAFTLDLLGEATVTEIEADAYSNEYLRLLETLGQAARKWNGDEILDRAPRVNLSIKVSALFSQFDPIDPEGTFQGVAGRLREIFRLAQKHNALINLDMEQFAYKNLTLQIFKRLLMEPEFRHWRDVGIVIQAYLRDAERDLEELGRWVRDRGTPVWVRLVKGAYWDYETVISKQMHWPIPVWQEKWQTDACFERCTEYLMQNHDWLRPAIASHNIRTIAHALATAEVLGLAKGDYELQMLYGMADPIKKALVDRGERVRVYTPFGKLLPGMAYLVRRLLENTSNSSFLRARFVKGNHPATLLAKPAGVVGAKIDEVRPFVNEPLSDFSREENRVRMVEALGKVRREFGRCYPLVIGGKPVATAEHIESVNPADTSQLLGKVSSATAAQADEAVAAAKAAYPGWRATPVGKRADFLFAIASRLRQKRWELAAWMVYETGKQWREADADVAEAIDFCDFYAQEMLALNSGRRRNLPGEENQYFYVPRGVTVAIAPWNFPLAILTGMTVAPLVAGNTVVMKPAEQSSIVAAKLAEILESVDLPAGVVNFLPGLGEVAGKRLMENPDVATVVFTGSVGVGRQITEAAARQMVKRVVAEMGGKNAIIIDEDADLDEAIRGVVASAFGYQGQKCSACSRVIVLPRVYDAFVARLKQAVASLSIGPPVDPAYTVGPVIDRDSLERLRNAIEQGKREATLLIGVEADSSRGYFLGPHVFVDVDPKSTLGQVELFGPVLAVIRAMDMDDAFRIANDTDYALTGGVYSRNPHTLARAKDEFLVGNLYLNRKITGALVDVQPFGGFKLSGIGAKAGGPDYLKQFLVPRTVTENTLRRGFAPDQA